MTRLGRWRLDDGVAPDARAAVELIGGGVWERAPGDVAQVSGLPIGVAQAFGLWTDGSTVNREAAMRIPAVRRGRQVIVGSIATCPLVAHRTLPDGNVEAVDRPLLEQPDPNTTRQFVLGWTVDDLLFHGISWWVVNGRDDQGYPTAVEWVSRTRLAVDLIARKVWVDGRDRTADMIRFDGPDEGVLAYQGDTLTTSQLLSQAVRKFARLDVPLGALKLKEGATELSNAPGSCGIPGDDRSAVDLLLDMWEDARRTRTTAYLNGAIDYDTFQLDAARIELTEGRREQNADVARLMNLAPRYVNAPNASGMTYTNVQSERQDLVDTTLSGFIAAIEQRLSMGDVTPRTQKVRLDVSGLLRGDTKTALESAEIAHRLDAMTSPEIRTRVLGLTPVPGGIHNSTPEVPA